MTVCDFRLAHDTLLNPTHGIRYSGIGDVCCKIRILEFKHPRISDCYDNVAGSIYRKAPPPLQSGSAPPPEAAFIETMARTFVANHFLSQAGQYEHDTSVPCGVHKY